MAARRRSEPKVPDTILVICLREDVIRSLGRSIDYHDRLELQTGIVNQFGATLREYRRLVDDIVLARFHGSTRHGNGNEAVLTV